MKRGVHTHAGRLLAILLPALAIACSLAAPTDQPDRATDRPGEAGPTSEAGSPRGNAPGLPEVAADSPVAAAFRLPPHMPAGPEQPDPLHVQVTLDESRTARAVIPTAGGSLEATGADGARYRLAIPATALLAPTEVSMTPIAGIASFDDSGEPVEWPVPLGVDLSPDGLRLYDWATLEIVPADGNGAVPARAFGYSAQGDEFHPRPLDLDATRISVHLLHFSGTAAYIGDAGPIPVAPSRQPVDWEAQIEQAIAVLTERQRAAELLGDEGDPQFWEQLERLYDIYYERVVVPLLGRMETDCAFARANVHTPLAWARGAQLFEFSDEDSDPRWQRIKNTLVKALENCWEDEKSGCVDPQNAEQVARVLMLAREGQLLTEDEEAFDHTFILDEDSSRLCGDVFGTIVWRHELNERPNPDWNAKSQTNEVIMVNVNLDYREGEWVDRGSSYSWQGSQQASSSQGPCGSSDSRSWHGGGSFRTDYTSIDLYWDSELEVASLGVSVDGQMNGRKLYRGIPEPPPEQGQVGEWLCFVPPHSEEYEQGAGEWSQYPTCSTGSGADLEGHPTQDRTALDFACQNTESGPLNDGDYEMTINVTGSLTVRQGLD